MLQEAFDSKRREFGEVKFSATSLDDPHVKKIIDEIASKHNIDKQKLLDEIGKKVKEFDDIAAKSPILYDTIKKNIIEQQVFDMIEKHPIADKAPKFEVRLFSKLLRFIKIEHDQFFPLRNFIDHKYLYNPVIILVPSPAHVKYGDVDTAAATPSGEFIFNKIFMQKLIDYAHLKGVKPKGKKYVSNGGEIPDEYAYIEFLIIHEFMHYTYADFHYQKKLKANPKIINWVGDFRTNYLLVKSGFEQLPIGLFSDHVNYDRQKSYKEMYDIVKAEFDKLNKDQQQKVENMMDGLGDNHDQDGGEPGEPGEAGKGSPGKGDKSNDDKKKGEPDDTDDNGDIFDELDKNNEDIEKKISGGKEIDKEEDKPKDEGKKAGTGSGSGNGGRSSGKDGDGTTFDYSKIRPTFTWKKLLSKMVTDASSSVEETFQKPHRRNITGVHLAQQTGSAAMKPGEVPLDNEIKMGFVVDSSGSMTHVIGQVYANMHSLMKSKSNVNKANFYLIKFSGDHHIFKCNFSRDKYTELSSVFDKSAVEHSGSVKELFSKHIGSSTNFSDRLTHEISLLANKKYNLLIMSDSDILYGENFENVKKLIVEHKNVFIILDSRQTFIRMSQMLKQVSKNITYFE